MKTDLSQNPKSLVVIPARGGSVSIPGKNLQEVNNLPLILRSIRHSLRFLQKDVLVCISSDSETILRESIKFINQSCDATKFVSVNNEIKISSSFVIHRRPSLLSDANSSTWNLLIYLSRKLKIDLQLDVSKFLILQPTSPFRNEEELSYFQSIVHPNCEEEVISVRKLGEVHPERMYRIDRHGNLSSLSTKVSLSSFKPRQELEPLFIRDGGYYLVSSQNVGSHGPKNLSFKAYVRKFPWNLNIDELSDLIIAKSIPTSLYEGDPNEIH